MTSRGFNKPSQKVDPFMDLAKPMTQVLTSRRVGGNNNNNGGNNGGNNDQGQQGPQYYQQMQTRE